MIGKKQAAAVIAIALEESGYQYRYQDMLECFFLDFKLKKSRLSEIQLIIHLRDDHIIIYAVSPVTANEKSLEKTAVYLTGCNEDIIYGNFELNLSTGEVRFKNVLSCTDVLPSGQTVKDMVNIPILMFERYGDGLLDVIYAGKDPVAALIETEDR